MPAVVVNHLTLNVPVDELAPMVAERFPAVFDEQPGFHAFYFVKEADDRAAAIIVWDTPEAAEAGARVIGPTLFDEFIVPRLAAPQARTAGPALVAHHRRHST
jgi:hypothetical protein